MAKPKICILFAGGTIGMIRNKETGALQPANNADEITALIPEIKKYLEIDFKFLFNIDSSNMGPAYWTKIAEAIKRYYSKYDGFVVIQGTDTMAYTASALSFSFQDLDKPIILTGSLIPLGEIGADARNNLIYACLTAAEDFAEVAIVFANRIIRGVRAKKHHESFVDVFHSPNYPYLGELGRPTVIGKWCKKRAKRKLKFQSKFEPKVALLKMFPGFDPEILEKSMERGVKGIIIEGFGPGNVPFLENSIIPKIEKARKKKIPVVIANQLEKGITNLDSYEAGRYAKDAGAISSADMTTEATLTKLMWVLAQTKDLKKIKKIMESNLTGELREGDHKH